MDDASNRDPLHESHRESIRLWPEFTGPEVILIIMALVTLAAWLGR